MGNNTTWDPDTGRVTRTPDPNESKKSKPPFALLTEDGADYYQDGKKVGSEKFGEVKGSGGTTWDPDTGRITKTPDPNEPKKQREPLALLTGDGVDYYQDGKKVGSKKFGEKDEKPADRYEGWSPDGPRYKVEYDEETGMFETPVNPYHQDEQSKRKFKGRMDDDGFIVFDEVDDKGNVISVAPTSLNDPPNPPIPAVPDTPAAPDPYEGWSPDDPKYKMRMDEETGLFVFDKNPYAEEPERHFKGRVDEETGLIVFDEVDEEGNVIRECPTSLDDDDDDDDDEEEEEEQKEEKKEEEKEEKKEEEEGPKADSGNIKLNKDEMLELKQPEKKKGRPSDRRPPLELL